MNAILRKKRILVFVTLILAFAVAFSACGKEDGGSKEKEKNKESSEAFIEFFPDEEEPEESSQSETAESGIEEAASEESADQEGAVEESVVEESVVEESNAEEGEAEEVSHLPEETPAPEEEAAVPEAAETPVPDAAVSTDPLIILTDPWEYYYTDMVADAQTILGAYAGLVTMDSIATTADGREMLHFVVGNPSADKQVFINGTTHAREYLTTQLVMKQMVVYLEHVKNGDYYGDVSYADMWNQVAIHVVPCVNPDGATLSQLGLAGMNYEETVQAVREVAAMDGAEVTDYYLNTWKANALGTDINRNYDALWEEYVGAGHPSSEMYKGEYPGSSIEAAAMIRLTEESSFLRTISYHTQGSVIYWNFYNVENFFDEAYGFASALSQTTGYYLWDDYQSIDALAYSDWGNYRLSIPSVTIECGYGEPPYMQDQFQTIWAENEHVWEVTVLSVM